MSVNPPRAEFTHIQNPPTISFSFIHISTRHPVLISLSFPAQATVYPVILSCRSHIPTSHINNHHAIQCPIRYTFGAGPIPFHPSRSHVPSRVLVCPYERHGQHEQEAEDLDGMQVLPTKASLFSVYATGPFPSVYSPVPLISYTPSLIRCHADKTERLDVAVENHARTAKSRAKPAITSQYPMKSIKLRDKRKPHHGLQGFLLPLHHHILLSIHTILYLLQCTSNPISRFQASID